MRIKVIILLGAIMLNILAINAEIRVTVGSGKQFTTINAALQSVQKPLTDNVVVVVDIPSGGYTEIGTTVDISTLQANGFTVSIIPSNGKLFTYYVGGNTEFRFRDGDDVTRVETSPGANGVLARWVKTNNVNTPAEYLVKNHLGSTITTIGDDGQRNGPIYEYYAFGKQVMLNVAPTGTGLNILSQTFTGKEMDLFTGDYPQDVDGQGWDYFGARYYDADIGIWNGVDPLRQFHDIYSYCGGNPVNYIDPNGAISVTDDGGTCPDVPTPTASDIFTSDYQLDFSPTLQQIMTTCPDIPDNGSKLRSEIFNGIGDAAQVVEAGAYLVGNVALEAKASPVGIAAPVGDIAFGQGPNANSIYSLGLELAGTPNPMLGFGLFAADKTFQYKTKMTVPEFTQFAAKTSFQLWLFNNFGGLGIQPGTRMTNGLEVK